MAAGGEVAGGMEESNKEVMAFRYEILLPNMPIIRSVGLGGTVPNSELNGSELRAELGSEPTKSNFRWPDSATTSKTEQNQTRFGKEQLNSIINYGGN